MDRVANMKFEDIEIGMKVRIVPLDKLHKNHYGSKEDGYYVDNIVNEDEHTVIKLDENSWQDVRISNEGSTWYNHDDLFLS